MYRVLRSAPTVLAMIAILLLSAWPPAPLRAQAPQPELQATPTPLKRV